MEVSPSARKGDNWALKVLAYLWEATDLNSTKRTSVLIQWHCESAPPTALFNSFRRQRDITSRVHQRFKLL